MPIRSLLSGGVDEESSTEKWVEQIPYLFAVALSLLLLLFSMAEAYEWCPGLQARWRRYNMHLVGTPPREAAADAEIVWYFLLPLSGDFLLALLLSKLRREIFFAEER